MRSSSLAATPEIDTLEPVPPSGLSELGEAASRRERRREASTRPERNQNEIFFPCRYNGCN